MGGVIGLQLPACGQNQPFILRRVFNRVAVYVVIQRGMYETKV